MATGLPLVISTSDFYDANEFEETVLKFKVKNVKKMAEKVDFLLKDSKDSN